MDKLTPARRSENMRRIRSSGTQPEKEVERLLRRSGVRYKRQMKSLPGSPDFYLPAIEAAVFVHGCFWHAHSRCVDGHLPKSKRGYWSKKLEGNVVRDARNRRRLHGRGIGTLTLWECETKDESRLARRLSSYLARRHGRLPR